MFNRKSKKIQKLTNAINSKTNKQIEEANNFILILKQIQEFNNSDMQWKKKQKTIDNTINLAIENYEQKIVELDIDPQY